ncbi:MAG: hypothetical protein V1815_00760 [Candidatus Woesearchaeota archaeon]
MQENKFFLVTRNKWVSGRERSDFYTESYPVRGDLVEAIKQNIYDLENGVLELTGHQGNYCVVNIPFFYRYNSRAGNVHGVIYPGLENVIKELQGLDNELWTGKPPSKERALEIFKELANRLEKYKIEKGIDVLDL